MLGSYKLIGCVLLFLMFNVGISAQTVVKKDTLSVQVKQVADITLKGRIIGDKEGEFLPGAHIYIGEKKTPVAVTDRDGLFTLSHLPDVEIVLSVSYTGYQFFSKKYVLKSDLNIGDVKLTPIILEEVVVLARPPLSVQRGDTTQFNAAALALPADADLEKLLKKLPGFEIVDGKIMAQGQEVKKLYVDGTEYFLNNPTAALKNLPASLISKIKMYDDRSEEAKFSGYDDGSKLRTLNVETKNPNDLKYFGRGNVGYGISDEIRNTFKDNNYNAGLSASLFDKKRRITLNANADNTDQANTLPDAKYIGEGGENGSKNVLLNYSSSFNKKIFLTGNYQGSWRNSYSANLSKQEYFPTERYENRIYDQESHSWSDGKSHSLNARVDYRISEKDRVIFSPRISLNTNGNKSVNLSNSIENNDTINNSNTLDDGQNNSSEISGQLSWMHAFEKPGRTLTTSLNLNSNNTTSDQSQIVQERYLNSQNLPTDTLRNKHTTNDRLNYVWGAGLSYSEPLSKQARLGFNYRYNYSMDQSDKESISFRDREFQDRIGVDSALTNVLKNLRTSNQLGVNYNYNKEKISLNGGGNVSMTQMENRYVFLGATDSVVNSRYVDLSPRVDLRYRFEDNQSLSASYNGNTSSPNARQLQSVLDVSNPLQVSKGNPNLKKSYTQNIDVTLNRSDPKKSTFFFATLSGGMTLNKITSNVKFIGQDTLVNGYLLLRGARLTTPVNLNGDWNISGTSNYSYEWKKLKLRFNTSLTYGFSHSPSIYDDLKNFTDAHSGSLGISISPNVSENLDLFVNSNSSYSYSTNSTTGSSQYFNESLNVNGRWIFWKGFLIGGDFSYTYYVNKRGESINQSNSLLNLEVGKKFGKKQQAELQFAANDIFRQRNTVNYSLSDLYAQTSYSTNVNTYYMLTFSYRFSSMGEGREDGKVKPW